jgi:hypothetical protein
MKVEISNASVQSILHKDLNMHYLCQSLQHKGTRMNLARALITMADQDITFHNNMPHILESNPHPNLICI